MSEEIERRPASENPWYVLMTIAGEQGDAFDAVLHARNRRFWHGWLAQGLDEDVREKLIADGVVKAAEFAPFTEQEQNEWERAVASRLSGNEPSQDDVVDFSGCEFDAFFSCDGFYFATGVDFRSASFSGIADFERASFSGNAHFGSASFSGDAHFGSASFSGNAHFGSASFSGDAYFGSASFSGLARFGSARFSGDADFVGASL